MRIGNPNIILFVITNSEQQAMKFITIVVFVLMTCSIKAQNNFFTRIPNDSLQGAWAKDVKVHNGKIYTYGGHWYEDFGFLNGVNFNIYDIIGNMESLLKYERLEDTISIFPGRDGYLTHADSSFFLSGSTNQVGYYQGIIFKWDYTNNLVTQTYVSKDSGVIFNYLTYSGGYLYVLGEIYDTINLNNTTVLLMKFDKDLNLLWEFMYGGQDFELPGRIYPTSDSGVVFGCTSGPYYEWYGHLVKVSKDGDLVYDKPLSQNKGQVFLLDYDTTNEDVVIMRYKRTLEGFNGNELWYLNVIKMDSNLNILWDKQWYAIANFQTQSIKNNIWNAIRIDNGYVLCGENTFGGWVLCLDDGGSKIWEATYTYLEGVNYGSTYPEYYISGIDTLSNDKGYVLSGSTFDTLSRQVAFIMSIDKDGCFSDDTCEAKQYVSITYYDAAIKVQVFPNPIKDYVSIKVTNAQLNGAEIVITDLLGRTVAKQTLLQELTTFSTQDWANGMYVWSLVEDGRLVRSGKLVKE